MLIGGIDEVGWGALAGPVTFAITIFPEDQEYPDFIKDSKKLSAKKRKLASEWIKANAVYYRVSDSPASWIDRFSLSTCRDTAFSNLVYVAVLACGPLKMVYIDGAVDLPSLSKLAPTKTVIKGDSLYKEVSAASIIAKHDRDSFMISLKDRYPEIEFEKHKGYGTPKHIAAIKQHGTTRFHRKSINLVNQIKKAYNDE